MTIQKKEWHYIDDQTGERFGPVTLEELDELHRTGAVEEYTMVINPQLARRGGLMASSGIPYATISRLSVEFSPSIEEFLSSRNNKLTTILSGPNNCGKTLMLKQLFAVVGHDGYMIACSRLSHVDVLNTRKPEKHEHRRYFDNFINDFHTSQNNSEDNQLRLEQIITGLRDTQRDKLFGVCKDLLGNKFSLQRTDPENTFSPFYVDMDGENLRYGSSGTRLLMTLLGILLDERFSIILIDEPEIGLSPRIQAVLAKFLLDNEHRQRFCPHIRQLYITTHSHLFLDRGVFSNNYLVSKAENIVSIKPVQSVGDFHQLQFNMLGNELESIFLPSVIVIVEGDSDVTFITKVAQLHIPDRKVAIVRAGGDGEVQNKLNVLKEAFGDISTNPYRDRLFVVLDRTHSLSLARLENQGVTKDNIIVWSQNGIEYFYPEELVTMAFRCDAGELATGNFQSDPIEFNGIRKSKKELAQFVTEGMMATHYMHPELQELVGRLRASCK